MYCTMKCIISHKYTTDITNNNTYPYTPYTDMKPMTHFQTGGGGNSVVPSVATNNNNNNNNSNHHHQQQHQHLQQQQQQQPLTSNQTLPPQQHQMQQSMQQQSNHRLTLDRPSTPSTIIGGEQNKFYAKVIIILVHLSRCISYLSLRSKLSNSSLNHPATPNILYMTFRKAPSSPKGM